MQTVTCPPDTAADLLMLQGPDVTPEFAALLEEEAARRGLPPEPWPLP